MIGPLPMWFLLKWRERRREKRTARERLEFEQENEKY